MTRPVQSILRDRKSVHGDTAIGRFCRQATAKNIDIVWPGDRYAASDGRTIEYSAVSQKGGRGTDPNLPSRELQVFRESAAKVSAEVVPDKREHETDTAGDSE